MTDVRGIIDDYLARLDRALRAMHEREREELVAEVRAHLENAAASAADPADAVHRSVRSLGDPASLAARMHAGDDEPAAERAQRVLGMPYDFRRLTAEEIARRIWNPSDPRVLMPHLFGIGWSINFGAVAVRLGLVRADDEDVIPFAGVSERSLDIGLALVTIANLVAIGAAWAFRSPAHPVPVHWGLTSPDSFTTPLWAALAFLGPAVALNALALVRAFASRRASRLERTLSVAGLAFAVALLDGSYADGLAYAVTGTAPFSPGLPVLAGFVLSFVVLVLYSRLGVRSEWRSARLG